MKYLIFLIILSCFLIGHTSNIFSDTFKVSIQIQKDRPDKKLQEYYKFKNGINFDLEFPFDVGFIKTSLDFSLYDNLTSEYRNFISIHPNIVWGMILKLNQKIEWFNGLSMGGYIYYFKDSWKENFTLGSNTETEVSFGLLSSFSYYINNNFHLIFSVKNYNLLTYQNINIISLSIGIGKTINNPAWLNKVLN
jgi:hypothetical protein